MASVAATAGRLADTQAALARAQEANAGLQADLQVCCKAVTFETFSKHCLFIASSGQSCFEMSLFERWPSCRCISRCNKHCEHVNAAQRHDAATAAVGAIDDSMQQQRLCAIQLPTQASRTVSCRLSPQRTKALAAKLERGVAAVERDNALLNTRLDKHAILQHRQHESFMFLPIPQRAKAVAANLERRVAAVERDNALLNTRLKSPNATNQNHGWYLPCVAACESHGC